jgi:hypothetical protein
MQRKFIREFKKEERNVTFTPCVQIELRVRRAKANMHV